MIPQSQQRYIVYTDALDDACGAQLSQEHDATEFPSHFYPILSLKYKENEAQLNKRPMEFTMLSPSGIITSKVQIS